VIDIDRIKQTKADLDRDNEIRRARIRGLHSEIAALHQKRETILRQYASIHGDMPPRGWDESFRCELATAQGDMERLGMEIAMLQAGPGYFSVQPVVPEDVRRVIGAVLGDQTKASS
jgi:hypothetical protein